MFNFKNIRTSSLVLEIFSISIAIIFLVYLIRYFLIEYKIKKTLNIKYNKFILRLFPKMWRRFCIVVLLGSSIPLILFIAKIKTQFNHYVSLPAWFIIFIVLGGGLLSIFTMLMGFGVYIKTKKDRVKVEFLNVEKLPFRLDH